MFGVQPISLDWDGQSTDICGEIASSTRPLRRSAFGTIFGILYVQFAWIGTGQEVSQRYIASHESHCATLTWSKLTPSTQQ